MEMGVPGLKAAQVGVDAEIKALQDGVASIYPNINGTSDVKAGSISFYQGIYRYRYCAGRLRSRNRLHAGTYASFLVCGQCTPGKDTILFIDPGFPVQKQQITVMGYRYESFDVYEYRGEKTPGHTGTISLQRQHRSHDLLQSQQSGLVLPDGRRAEDHRRHGKQI